MRLSKRHIRRIVKEEKLRMRLLREQEAADSREHHWPSADGAIGEVVDELTVAWTDMENNSWSAGDPSMNKQGELSDAESKQWWGEQVEAAAADFETALEEALRQTSIRVMQEFTDNLINGDYA